MTRKLTILALDAVVPLDLAIAAQLMGYPMAPYDVTICGLRSGQEIRIRVITTNGTAVSETTSDPVRVEDAAAGPA